MNATRPLPAALLRTVRALAVIGDRQRARQAPVLASAVAAAGLFCAAVLSMVA